jgi:hypothetical protein
VRALILSLALANLLFFGWARWIDQPVAGRAAAAGGVPPLQLVSSGSRSTRHATLRCASLGPFIDGETATAIGTALRSRGLEPRERVSPGEAADGYWVYIDNLRDPDARGRALKKLAKAGIRDTAVMASSGQVSLGLFSGQEGAEMRATSVRSAGLEPIIKPRLRPVDEHWFDVQFPGDVPLPAVDALMSGLAAEQPPSWANCPGSNSATSSTAASSVAPNTATTTAAAPKAPTAPTP